MNKSLWATLATPLVILALYFTLSGSNLPAINYTYLIASLGVTATVYLGLVKYWIDSDAMFKTLFKDFNERFDLLNENLNNIVAGEPVAGEKSTDQIIQAYLNLCSEEYFWFKKGRIPKAVWASWLAGIEYYLLSPPINAYFKEQMLYRSSYYGFLTVCQNKLK